MRIILRASLYALVLFPAFLALGPATAFAGTTTLVTYYPAPNGNYSKVTLYPQTQPSGACKSGAMYVDNTTGAVGYCVDNNIKPTDGTLIGGTLAGTGSWGKFQASTPVNFNDVANKGYVDAAVANAGSGVYTYNCFARDAPPLQFLYLPNTPCYSVMSYYDIYFSTRNNYPGGEFLSTSGTPNVCLTPYQTVSIGCGITSVFAGSTTDEVMCSVTCFRQTIAQLNS